VGQPCRRVVLPSDEGPPLEVPATTAVAAAPEAAPVAAPEAATEAPATPKKIRVDESETKEKVLAHHLGEEKKDDDQEGDDNGGKRTRLRIATLLLSILLLHRTMPSLVGLTRQNISSNGGSSNDKSKTNPLTVRVKALLKRFGVAELCTPLCDDAAAVVATGGGGGGRWLSAGAGSAGDDQQQPQQLSQQQQFSNVASTVVRLVRLSDQAAAVDRDTAAEDKLVAAAHDDNGELGSDDRC